MMKKHRRINWFRRVLTFTLVFCLVVYVTMMFVTFLSNNDGKVREDLAREMADTASPVIELFGGDMQIAVGDSFCEPGFDIFDDRDLPEVEIESDVNVRQEGEYEIKYTASDESGNHNSMSRKVKVIQPAGRIYLTFDDGPSDYTGVLLDTLKKYGVKATFFVTSYGDDALIRREYDEGHAVGLHTASHVYSYVYSSPENYWADLNQVQDRVKNITGKRSHLIRFPGGSSNMISAWYDGGSKIMSRLSSEVEGQGYAYFDWNVDSGDAGGAGSADEVYNNVVNALKWGGDSVILQHDTKPYSVEAVERIIQYGLENNFVFEILSTNTFTVHHGVNN